MKLVVYFLFLFIPTILIGQDTKSVLGMINDLDNRKGQAYIYWGYNRSFYNASDIHFKGEGFDFTLHQAKAADMPERFDPSVYFNMTTISVPQFNFRFGYFIGKNTSISIGWDHMKYRLIQTQRLRASGYIDPSWGGGNDLAREFKDEYILYNPSFMDFHHSDGFNYARLAIEQRVPVWMSKNGKHHLSLNGAASLGVVIPWTDWTFFSNHYRNKLHLAGYGASLSLGARFEFFKWFFVQGFMQAGGTNLVDIVLQDHLPSRADQKIHFVERSWAVGGFIPISKEARKKKVE